MLAPRACHVLDARGNKRSILNDGRIIEALSRIRPGAKKARTSATVTSLAISIFLAVFDNHICIKLLFMRLLKARRTVMRTRRRSSISIDVASIGLGSLEQFLSMYAMAVKI